MKEENQMYDHLIKKYSEYHEEFRLLSENTKKIEYINTIRILKNILPMKKGLTLLDCSSGTGIYSFKMAEYFKYKVVATDITPRHIKYIEDVKRYHKTDYEIVSKVLDACDMKCFTNEEFDIVFNMGAFYHATKKDNREKCINECLRVLKKGGIFVLSYINRNFYIPYLFFKQNKNYDLEQLDYLLEFGIVDHKTSFCPFTDLYCSTCDEMEKLFENKNLLIVQHAAIDYISILERDIINSMNKNEIAKWSDFIFKWKENKNFLNMSNHCLIIGRK